jgi:DNA-binding PadR family transcriptional regulator
LTLLEREGFVEGKWADPTKRSIRIYSITPDGRAELSRLKTIVAPKVAETVHVLEAFMKDLQGQEQPPER